MMNASEFAAHTHEQEIHRLLVLVEKLRAQRDNWHEMARQLCQQKDALANELEALKAAHLSTPREPRPDDLLPLPWLREWREHQGILQGELARAAGVWQKDLSWLERGKRLAYRATAEKLAVALGITLEELLTRPGGEA